MLGSVFAFCELLCLLFVKMMIWKLHNSPIHNVTSSSIYINYTITTITSLEPERSTRFMNIAILLILYLHVYLCLILLTAISLSKFTHEVWKVNFWTNDFVLSFPPPPKQSYRNTYTCCVIIHTFWPDHGTMEVIKIVNDSDR